MYANPLQISTDTLIGVSEILGHRLEERSAIRDAQFRSIVEEVQDRSTVELRDASQQDLFCVAPLDILVTDEGGRKQFHIIELNGTGIGGLTNIYEEAIGGVLEGLQRMAEMMPEPDPVIMVASSGLESEQQPRRNKLIYEKVLYVEALRRGFVARGQRPAVSTVLGMRDAPWEMNNGRPTIILGYMKEFLRFLRMDADGNLSMHERPVRAAVNDRFCLNLVHSFGSALKLDRCRMMNRCFVPGADKAVAYALLNEFLDRHPTPITRPVKYVQAGTRDELIEVVLGWVRQGVKAVIKPSGTGLGHGIDFFLNRDEPDGQVIARIDNSLRLTERYYNLHGGALPYTVCEFLDTAVIRCTDHPACGHKFELRVVVYRDGMTLKAFPSIIKISSELYHPNHPSHLSLINNITASAVATQTAGFEHMMPLCNPETLELIGLTVEELQEVSGLATRFVRFVLDQVQDAPERVGLAPRRGERQLAAV